ncbi:hypothetical protein GCM10023224_46230 [Streptomonospora halophila]|uniref:Uncharacterized protein n=1 Tax=Streptomonospora halophila TaxID=427369 RepID=A0ABP9GYU0_9ACTN
MADGYEEGRRALGAWFGFGAGPGADPEEARAFGGFLSLLIGMLVQHGIDPSARRRPETSPGPCAV